MAWKYRKRVRVFPGFHINLSKSGVSYTIGGRGASVNIGKKGTYLNTSLPGTGLYNRQKISNPQPNTPQPQYSYNYTSSGIEETSDIKSIAVEEITSQGLLGLKESIQGTIAEGQDIRKQISILSSQYKRLYRKFKFRSFPLWKWIFKSQLPNISKNLHEYNEHLAELNEQLNLTKVNVDIEFDKEIKDLYEKLIDTFSQLIKSNRIWDVTSSYHIDRVAERSSASQIVERRVVSFELKGFNIIDCKYPALHLKNANGGDMYFYPNFVLMQNQNEFGLIDFKDLEFSYYTTEFTETQSIPADSHIAYYTWYKVNKNGTPDKRFANNYQIPVVNYGSLTFQSGTGLHERYLISNNELAIYFAQLFGQYKSIISKI